MKKIILTVVLTFVAFAGAFAQRFAFVDSEYILRHVPEYTAAQTQLKTMSDQWQKEVDARFQEIDRLYKAYQADQVLMTADMKKKTRSRNCGQGESGERFSTLEVWPRWRACSTQHAID